MMQTLSSNSSCPKQEEHHTNNYQTVQQGNSRASSRCFWDLSNLVDCGHVERPVRGLAGWRSRRGRGAWQSLVVVVDETPLLGALAVWGTATAAVVNAVLKPAGAYGAREMAV